MTKLSPKFGTTVFFGTQCICLSVLDLGPMYATDGRQTASSLYAPSYSVGRDIITMSPSKRLLVVCICAHGLWYNATISVSSEFDSVGNIVLRPLLCFLHAHDLRYATEQPRWLETGQCTATNRRCFFSDLLYNIQPPWSYSCYGRDRT